MAKNSDNPSVRADAVLDVSDLAVVYPDGTRALNSVSFAIAPGQRVGLIGPNGSGKTSLLLAIMGGLKYDGRVIADGVELTRRSAQAVRSRCGLTFQDADDQLFMPTLLEDVAFGPLNQGLAPDVVTAIARDSIGAVGLAGCEERPAHHLSGGQKRNAALATILAMRVKLLLLDEPGSNLDFRSRRRLMDLLAGRGEAQLLATHDLDMVERLCDRVILLDAGRLMADGSAADILADRKLLAAHGLAE